MSHSPFRARLAFMTAGLAVSALAAFASAASAAVSTPDLINPTPIRCVRLIGDPRPCPPPPPPTHPEPVDPSCLRTDVEPLHCPYLP